MLLKEKDPLIRMIHCFNHPVEAPLKNLFRTTSFKEVDSMLCKLYYLYQKNPKRLSEFRELFKAYYKTLPKPSKVTGTRWIHHNYRTMELFLTFWPVYVTLGTVSTGRFPSSKTSRDLKSCKKIKECQFYHQYYYLSWYFGTY